MSLTERVVRRFLEAYKRPDNMVPVWNTEKERTVYVLPETLKEEGGKYEKLDPDDTNSQGKPTYLRHPGQPQLPRKPKKPRKAPIERKPIPAPPHPPLHPSERKNLPPRKPTPVKPVKPPKVPEPPKHQDFKKVKRYLKADDELSASVVQKFLARLEVPV
jgi:hypothetical protein